MDTEKIKQMGRDYFTANPPPMIHPFADSGMWELWRENVMATDGKNNKGGREWAVWKDAWISGYDQARYAASKEGRAIELLGRLFMEHPSTNLRPAWAEAGEFLQEIGWKPNA